MRTIVLVTFLLSVFTFLTLPLSAQEVEVVCSDNQTIQGSLEGFQEGKYRIRVRGELKVIPEDDVITLTILDRREHSTSGLEGVEVAFGEGRIMDAMRAIHHMLNQIPFKSRDLRRLALEQHRTGIDHLLKQRNPKELQDTLLSSLEVFSTPEEEGLLQHFQREVSRRRDERPDDPYTLSLAGVLSVVVHRMAILPAAAKETLPPLLERVADLARTKENKTVAWKAYRALVRVDPSREEGLRDLRMSVTMEDAAEKLAEGNIAGSVEAANEVLLLHPNHPGAFDVRETAIFNHLQSKLSKTSRKEERKRLIQEYLGIAQKNENRDWAMGQLKMEAPPEQLDALVFEQMRKYYPLRAGATWRYQLGKPNSGSNEPRSYREIRIREIDETENGRRVSGTVETEVGNSSSSKPLRIRVEGDSIFLSHGSGALLAFPLQRGHWWEWGGNSFRKEEQKHIRKVTSDSRTVKTPYGTFNNCIEVTFSTEFNQDGEAKRIESKEYYAPHVGLVKIDYLDPNYHQHNMELVDYRNR
jgi:hypothetical protein